MASKIRAAVRVLHGADLEAATGTFERVLLERIGFSPVPNLSTLYLRVNKRTAMRWIVDEVDELVETGVLTSETGTALRHHYEQKLAQEDSGGKTVLLAVLGATLIGAGIILIIAHNWDDLGRPARTALSLLPLLAGIALSLWALLKQAASIAWREGAGVAHCAGVAASIALISQTYHISGELSDFLFTWLLLILPIPYLLRAFMPALIYLAGIAVWAGTSFELFSASYGAPGYWLFLVAILPFYGYCIREDRLGRTTAWLSAVLGVSMAFGLGFTYMCWTWIPAFCCLFGLFYLAGVLLFPERRYNPLRVMGGVGTGYLAVLLSFRDMWNWNHVTWSDLHWPVYVLALGLAFASLALLAWALRRREDFNRFAAALPVVALLGFGINMALLHGQEARTGAAILFNFYAFVLALGTAFRGLQQRAFATLNGGLLILAALIVSRFVDSEFSTVARGIAFVVLGCVMLGANFWLLKTKRGGNA